MKDHNATFLASAVNPADWPDSELGEIVFVGRSNAGKSSLINALLNRKNLAFSSRTPGRTAVLNFYLVDNSFMLVDAPGYGYAKGGNRQVSQFSGIMEPYFRERHQLRGMVLVLDIRREPNDDDLLMLQYARDAHVAVFPVCTKSDKAGQSETARQLHIIGETLHLPAGSLIVCSSVKHTGLDSLWDRMSKQLDR